MPHLIVRSSIETASPLGTQGAGVLLGSPDAVFSGSVSAVIRIPSPEYASADAALLCFAASDGGSCLSRETKGFHDERPVALAVGVPDTDVGAGIGKGRTAC